MKKQDFMNWSIDSTLRIGLAFLIIFISFLIFRPFIVLIAWGAIIAIAFYPIQLKLTKLFKGKKGLAAIALTLVLLAILIIPSVFFVNMLVDDTIAFAEGVKMGTIGVPSPDASVKDWPIVGGRIYDLWSLSSTNLESAIIKYHPQVSKISGMLLDSVGGLVGSVFVFFFAVIISGLLLTNADGAYSFMLSFAEKMVGKGGKQLVNNSRETVKSVVKGVIGVALIQSILVGIGFWVADVPGAAVLTLIVFIFAIVQLPPIILVIPVIIYVFSVESTTVAIIFTIYELIAGASDNVLKPLLLGRGVAIPMLVILIGAIGGMILMGMIGLFVGAVVLALAYQLFNDWINITSEEESVNNT